MGCSFVVAVRLSPHARYETVTRIAPAAATIRAMARDPNPFVTPYDPNRAARRAQRETSVSVTRPSRSDGPRAIHRECLREYLEPNDRVVARAACQH